MSFPYLVSGIKPLTDTILQIILSPVEHSFEYQAGQYVHLELSDHQSMPFSIASAPLGSRELEFHIRHTLDNPFTTQLMKDITAHQLIQVQGPEGQCTYPTLNPKKPLLLLAGGTGFAPIKALIEQALANHFSSQIHLYWAARSPSELYCRELADRWAGHTEFFQFTPIISTPHRHWTGLVGLVPEQLKTDFETLADYQVVAAGPPDFVLETYRTCIALHLPAECFYSDLFSFIEKPI